MAGTALANFNDFMLITGPAILTPPDQLLNEAVSQSYSLPRFLRGRDMAEVLQSGDRILDDVMFDESNTFQTYQPNEEFTWAQPQVVTQQAIDWRFTVDHMSWTDHEVILNINANSTRAFQMVQYKNLKRKLEQRCFTSIVKGAETKLWQLASNQTGATYATADMETNTGTEPYSIPNIISDDPTNYHAGGWSTIASIDPATESKWRNQRHTYDFDDPDDTDGDNDGLIDAFDNMWSKTHFMPPTGLGDGYFEPAIFRQVIFCSRAGQTLYKRLLRAANDTLVSKQDAAYNSPTFGGIDVVYISQLDSGTTTNGGTGHIFDRSSTDGSYVELYDEDGNNAAGTAVTNAVDGPRFWWVNGNYLKMIWHAERYFERIAPYKLERQPFTTVAPVDSWFNMFPCSRQRQGLVSPQ